MKKKDLILGLIILAVFLINSNAFAGFSLGISPVRWEAKGKPGKTLRKVVELIGSGGTIQKVKVGVGDWTLNDDGAPTFAEPESMPGSAASWIKFHPTALSVYPRQKKTLRLSITIPNGTPAGSYRVALFFEPPGSEEKGKEGAASVFIRGRLAMPIYITVGDARPDGEIQEVVWKATNGGDSAPSLKIHNKGNAHLRMNGFFAAQATSGKKFEGIIPALPLLPSQTRWIPLEFRGDPPPPHTGLELTLHVDLGNGEQKIGVTLPGKN